MLQQTPVNRVIPIWSEWLKRWPTPQDLASASKTDVIKAWGRLGYPRRALRLHESAKIIASQYKNQVPRSREELISLPGVGDYTAAAIAAFAFGEPALVLDINIRRFFARFFDGVESPSSAPTQVERRVRYELIPAKQGDIWAAATMEFGALICTARSPLCDECPLTSDCQWRAAGYPASAPTKKQAKFTGSDRQCRGSVMAYLRENPKATLAKLSPLWPDQSQLEKALKTLIADGLIETTGKSYRLAS